MWFRFPFWLMLRMSALFPTLANWQVRNCCASVTLNWSNSFIFALSGGGGEGEASRGKGLFGVTFFTSLRIMMVPSYFRRQIAVASSEKKSLLPVDSSVMSRNIARCQARFITLKGFIELNGAIAIKLIWLMLLWKKQNRSTKYAHRLKEVTNEGLNDLINALLVRITAFATAKLFRVIGICRNGESFPPHPPHLESTTFCQDKVVCMYAHAYKGTLKT